MPGAGFARPSDRRLGSFDERCAELDGRVTRFDGAGLRCLLRSRHLRRSREPSNHAFTSEDLQSFHDFGADNGRVRFPSLGQAEILECPVLGFDEVALDRSKRSVLHRQQKAFPHGEGVDRDLGRVGGRSERRRCLISSAGGFVASDLHADLEGAEGIAVTDLRPAGAAEIDGRRYDVVSEAPYVESGTRIRVFKHEGYRIVVQAIPDKNTEAS